jgi:NADH-quinone oxidoreductase subunit E
MNVWRFVGAGSLPSPEFDLENAFAPIRAGSAQVFAASSFVVGLWAASLRQQQAWLNAGFEIAAPEAQSPKDVSRASAVAKVEVAPIASAVAVEAGKAGLETPILSVAPVTLAEADADAAPAAEGSLAPVRLATAEEVDALAAAVAAIAPEDFVRPVRIDCPKVPDDLKLISGVGPKIEKKLHELGIFTFGQIQRWGAGEIAYVDDFIAFRGRIVRDQWIVQAAALARGGPDEYVRVFGKEPR